MPALAADHHVVAIDMRGYNLSDKPAGTEAYSMEKLVADVAATVRHFGHRSAIVVGHDWGGAVAWGFAMAHPDMVRRLVILNLPHPQCLIRELRDNPRQWKNSQYARTFQLPGAHLMATPGALSRWVVNTDDRAHYLRAFRRSDAKAMLSYYKANYPAKRQELDQAFPRSGKVRGPVLMVHGLKDQALLPETLNDTWRWIEGDLTLTTVPGAGHFVQHDAPDLVRRAILSWLGRDPGPATSDVMGRVTNERCLVSGGPVSVTALFLQGDRVIGFSDHRSRDRFAADADRHAAGDRGEKDK